MRTFDPLRSDEARTPLLGEPGRALLRSLREHPRAPTWNYRCGDQLTAEGLARVAAFERALAAADAVRSVGPGDGASGAGAAEAPATPAPPWLEPFVAFCLERVPFYRSRGGRAEDLTSIPPASRADLAREPWSFVPDGQPLEEMVVYNTSGTTGHPILIPSHPDVSTLYLPLLRRALSWHGVGLAGGAGRTSIVQVAWQRATLTYASISSYLDQAGFVKVNLNEPEWNHPADRAAFLDELDPEVYTGTPLSFLELAKLPLRTRPKALVSTALDLVPGLARRLTERFGCPVVDLYSSNETGPISASLPPESPQASPPLHRLLPHDLFLEVLDAGGEPCPAGVRGEVAVTGGRNPFLPLLRYRTGDQASRDVVDGHVVLRGLSGRAPVVFVSRSGRPVNNIDVTAVLRDLAIAEHSLVQHADGSLTLRGRGVLEQERKVREGILDVFGEGQALSVEELPEGFVPQGKPVPFRCDVPPVEP